VIHDFNERVRDAISWLLQLVWLLIVCAAILGVPIACLVAVIHFTMKYW
jgi:hypothetical protein